MNYCGQCGSALRSGARFCADCGASVRASASTHADSAPAGAPTVPPPPPGGPTTPPPGAPAETVSVRSSARYPLYADEPSARSTGGSQPTGAESDTERTVVRHSRHAEERTDALPEIPSLGETAIRPAASEPPSLRPGRVDVSEDLLPDDGSDGPDEVDTAGSADASGGWDLADASDAERASYVRSLVTGHQDQASPWTVSVWVLSFALVLVFAFGVWLLTR